MKFSDVQMIERLNAIHCASSFEDDNANNDEDEELTSTDITAEYQGLFSDDNLHGGDEHNGSEVDDTDNRERRISSQHSLLSFGETRWYSAWCVMLRFYCLFDALNELKEKCLVDPNLMKSGGSEFIGHMERIRKEQLFLILHFLRPLVEAIDFFQSDKTTSWDVAPLLVQLYSFYRDHSIGDDPNEDSDDMLLHFPRRAVDAAFGPRLALFERPFTHLHQLFTDEYARSLPLGVSIEDPRVESFGNLVEEDLRHYYLTSGASSAYEVINRSTVEARRYLIRYQQRLGITTATYLSHHCNEFPNLKKIFADLSSQPASSASVERSFSVQGCFLLPRRNRLGLQTVRKLMVIRMNYILGEKFGWLNDLEEYLDQSSIVCIKNRN